MRTGTIPFQFDIAKAMGQFLALPDARASAVQLTLPFVSVMVYPSIREQRHAQSLIVRLADRRVLNAQECCDTCITDALRSIQEIRSMLVDEQVELIGEEEGSLHGLIGLMLAAIRQFLTYEQSILAGHHGMSGTTAADDRHHEARQPYFDALEMLRGHLARAIGQLAIIADVERPSSAVLDDYQVPWDLRAYRPLAR